MFLTGTGLVATLSLGYITRPAVLEPTIRAKPFPTAALNPFVLYVIIFNFSKFRGE